MPEMLRSEWRRPDGELLAESVYVGLRPPDQPPEVIGPYIERVYTNHPPGSKRAIREMVYISGEMVGWRELPGGAWHDNFTEDLSLTGLHPVVMKSRREDVHLADIDHLSIEARPKPGERFIDMTAPGRAYRIHLDGARERLVFTTQGPCPDPSIHDTKKGQKRLSRLMRRPRFEW